MPTIRQKQTVEKYQPVMVICDSCGKSTKDIPDLQFAELDATWHTEAGQWLEDQHAKICQSCYQQIVKQFNIKYLVNKIAVDEDPSQSIQPDGALARILKWVVTASQIDVDIPLTQDHEERAGLKLEKAGLVVLGVREEDGVVTAMPTEAGIAFVREEMKNAR